jgi:predicted hotdog family 3-hydroxylacyl-ACP dehydratase
LKLPPYRIEDLLPHAPPMILLDEVTGIGEGTLSAALTIRPGIPFFEAGRGVAAHVAIEWMAQTCAAYVGVAALEAGEPIRLGLLLGTRNFEATVPWFLEGERLRVTVTLTYRDSEMGAFDCVVTRTPSGDKLAHACLTVYHPDDAMTLLAVQSTRMNE